MKATFFCLLTMFFGLSAVSAGTAAVKTEEKAAPAKNEVKAEKKMRDCFHLRRNGGGSNQSG